MMRCHSGSRCTKAAVEGQRFCAEHIEELARVRAAMQTEADRRIGRGRKRRGSTCCRPGCYQPRVPPAAYCDSCAEAGYVEEAL